MKAMKIKGIVFVFLSLFSLSVFPQVSKEELFDTVRSYEVDNLDMSAEYADRYYSMRSAFRYSIWWDDVFFVDKFDYHDFMTFEYEMWSSLDRRGKVAEMNGITDETGKEKVRDLISRWGIPELVGLFKREEGWEHKGYDPTLYIIRVVIRGGKIVSVNGIAIEGYISHSRFAYLNEHLVL